MWNLGQPEPLCGALWSLNLMWNLEPFESGTWNREEPGARFPAAAPNHPKALLEEPKLFKLLGKNRDAKIPGGCRHCVLVQTPHLAMSKGSATPHH